MVYKNNHPYALSDILIDIPKMGLDAIENLKLLDANLSATDRREVLRQALRNRSNRTIDTMLLKGADWKAKGNNKEQTL